MPEKRSAVSECLERVSPMTTTPRFFFSLIYEFTFHYIKEETACLYVAHQDT